MRFHYQFFANLLDTLNIGACLYDDDDRAVVWNGAFLRFFPEHEGHIHEGEPYRDNLLRFYQFRLIGEELNNIESFVSAGVARHRTQTRAYSFEHRGHWLRVSSRRMPDMGRLRIWVQVPPPRIDQAIHLPADDESDGDHQDVALLENMADGVTVIDAGGIVRSVNFHFLVLYGFSSKNAVLGRSFFELYHQAWTTADAADLSPDEIKSEEQILEENFRFTGAPFELPLPGDRWIRIIIERNSDGVSYCSHTDITEFKRRQQALERTERRARESEARYRLLADHLTDVIVGLDSTRCIRYISPSMKTMLGLDPNQLIGKPWHGLISTESGERYAEHHDGTHHRPETRYTFLSRRTDGEPIWIEKSVSVLPPQLHAEGIEIIFHLRDVSSRRAAELALDKANAELAAQAMTDSLTGLGNRRLFDATLAREWLRMRRDKESIALLMIDIDYFKMLNDRHGHQAGDDCIKRVAAEISKAARRPSDLAARYGGEEFVLLLPHTVREDAMRIAENLRLAVQTLAIDLNGSHQSQLTISIGVAATMPHTTDVDDDSLLRAADLALYKAKRNGRNRCEVAD